MVAQAHRGEMITVAGGRHVRLVGPDSDGSDRLLARIAADAGAAVDAVVGFWGSDWSRDISVQAAGSDEQFQAAAGGGSPSQWTDIAAVTVVEHVDPVNRTVRGQKIVFAPGAVNMSDRALRMVLTHELFHYAARADTALDAPRWLTEAVADYVARPASAPPSDARSSVSTLPSDGELDSPGPGRSLAYDRAWWFAQFVAATYGPAKLRELYLAACGAGHPETASAMQATLGADSQALLTRWQQWLTR